MTKQNLLPQYKGQINPAQAAEGIKVAIQNARDLLVTAELLLENGHWSHACSFAILSIEESGKPPIIRELLLARNGEDLKEGWRKYRSHTSKNAMWIFSELVSKGARQLEDFRPLFDDESDHPSLLDSIKQLGFYSGAYGNCNWAMPFEIIDQNLAKQVVLTAKMLSQAEPGVMSTKAELEIWVKHLRPVWKKDLETMKSALFSCYKEAKEKGVLSGKQSADDMAKFLGL